MNPEPRPEALDFLLTRRSRLAKFMTGPGPSKDEIAVMLRAASRSPDHGKMEPWRFMVLGRAAQDRLGALTRRLGADRGLEPEKIDKDAEAFEGTPVSVAVIASPKLESKIPQIEQHLSAGAASLALLNAALATGWGANWLSGWMAHDRMFLSEGLGLADHEFVAAFIHMGTPTRPANERPRPDLDAVVEWVDA